MDIIVLTAWCRLNIFCERGQVLSAGVEAALLRHWPQRLRLPGASIPKSASSQPCFVRVDRFRHYDVLTGELSAQILRKPLLLHLEHEFLSAKSPFPCNAATALLPPLLRADNYDHLREGEVPW